MLALTLLVAIMIGALLRWGRLPWWFCCTMMLFYALPALVVIGPLP